MRVIIQEPGEPPVIEEIENSLEAMQSIVDGYIEVFDPWWEEGDGVVVICNEEGKLMDLAPNIVIRNESGDIMDVISGTIILTQESGENFTDLSDNAIKKYTEILKGISVEPENSFSIYQLRFGAEYKFDSYDNMTKKGYVIIPTDYHPVYTGDLGNMSLEDIFVKFNMETPAGFRGHSLSISDIIVLRKGDYKEAYYVDSIGFRDVSERFLEDEYKPKKPPEIQPKETGPTMDPKLKEPEKDL